MTVDQNISSRIDLMRIILISGIVFVHVPYDLQTGAYVADANAFDWMRVFLGDSFFRIGVPCLSAISGYLLFRRGYDAFDYGKVVKSKVRTVLTPFLIWNLSLLALVLVIQAYGIGIGYFPDAWNASPREFLNLALATENFPVDVPIYFLRDLFVCILLSPILAALVRRAPIITCVVLFALAILPSVTIGLVLKKSILFSFTFGIFLALNQANLKALDRYARLGVVLTVALAALLAVGLYATGPDYPFWLDLSRNTLSIIGALGFWMLSALLIQSRLGQRLSQTGSLSFWIFCGHYPLLVAMWMVWNKVADVAFYPVFYIGSIIFAFTILVVSNSLISRHFNPLYLVLTGSRGRRVKSSANLQNYGTASGGERRPLAQQH